MKISGLTLIILMAMLLQGCYSPMETLERDLAKGFSSPSDIRYIGHESIKHEIADTYGHEKYLILDFRNESPLMDDTALQSRINQICKTVFSNQALIKNLSDQGYDMVSVSFDANSQYDCL